MALELRHCQHAIRLAEHRSFQVAAKALGISQPALSRSIQELERRAGTRLFNRAREGIAPTDAGRLFLDRAQAMVMHAAELEREIRLMRGLETGEVRVGAGVYPSEMFVAEATAEMHRRHPTVKISLMTSSVDALLQMVKRRELDFVVGDVITARADREFEIEPLGWHKAYIAVRPRHPLSTMKSPSLTQVLQYPLAFTTRIPADFLAELYRGLEPPDRMVEPPHGMPSIACDSPVMLRTIVAATDAFTFMPGALLTRDLHEGRLAIVDFEAPWLGRTFGVIRLASRTLSPAAETYIALLRLADKAAERRGEEIGLSSLRQP